MPGNRHDAVTILAAVLIVGSLVAGAVTAWMAWWD
jgi:hypothetical protein